MSAITDTSSLCSIGEKPFAIKEGYKKTKLGWIPEEWEVQPISTFGKVITGSTPSTGTLSYYGDDYLFVSPSDMDGVKFVVDTTKKLTKSGFDTGRLVKKGSTLFVAIGSTIGKTAMAGVDLITNQQINSVVSTKDNNDDFIYYQITYYADKISLMAGRQAVPIINKTTFSKILLKKPPLPEQQKIAAILSTWDRAIAKQQQLIAAKQEYKKGLMQLLLTGKLRFEGFEGEWERVKLSDVSVFRNGKGHEKSIRIDGDFVVVNSKFISTDGEVRKYTNDQLSPLNKDDIVMVMSDVPNGRALAKCYIIEEDGKYSLNQRICSLKTKKMNVSFLKNQLNRNKYYLKFNDGISQTNLKKKEVLNCPILRPELKEQQKIASVISAAETEITLLENELVRMRKQKRGLMQGLLTGEKRVTV